MAIQFDPSVLTDSLPALAEGFATTIAVWIGGVMIGMVIGFAIALLQIFCGTWVRRFLRVYIEIFRGTPFLVQLFVLYYGGPSLGLSRDFCGLGKLRKAFVQRRANVRIHSTE